MTSIRALFGRARELSMNEDQLRVVAEGVTGSPSLKGHSPQTYSRILTKMGKAEPRSDRATGKYAPKLQALWIAGWNLGVFRQKTDKAMMSFLKRQTGIDHSRFLHHGDDARKVIEALKGWILREMTAKGLGHSAIDLFTFDKNRPQLLNDQRFQIVACQWAILLACDHPVAMNGTLAEFVNGTVGNREFSEFSRNDWFAVMNGLGKLVRQVKQ
ncbi:conserved hypothetical protein [Roseibium sp. TrichSKD4]|uniref:regulatory protein GemA n=1 Tax=Roseibium sp. TrichSKD4 TaxID=744980 RepID=UPI0001E57614|nr:regulatory protein GemA [Roseibium sp. TrichSKD4]EFO30955.1 conserved hypothetical protein [Roseibium sp. TrichSKD4]